MLPSLHITQESRYGHAERLKLLAAEEYNYLNQSNCMTIDNVDDVEQFRLMKVRADSWSHQ